MQKLEQQRHSQLPHTAAACGSVCAPAAAQWQRAAGRVVVKWLRRGLGLFGCRCTSLCLCLCMCMRIAQRNCSAQSHAVTGAKAARVRECGGLSGWRTGGEWGRASVASSVDKSRLCWSVGLSASTSRGVDACLCQSPSRAGPCVTTCSSTSCCVRSSVLTQPFTLQPGGCAVGLCGGAR